MGRELAVGSAVRLAGLTERTFRITEVVGAGGSCVAYKVEFEERDGIRHNGILKEYCPLYLGLSASSRKDNPHLVVPEKHLATFEDGIDDFSNSYREISNYLAQHEEAVNYHPVPLGLYHGNGTVYSLSSLDYGKSYDKLNDRNLRSVLQVIRSLAMAVAQYHDAGYLHLDIKPENVLILDGVTEIVKLFDYDSLTRIEDLRRRRIQVVPQPGVYYVPELNDQNLRAISKQTDILEIGALLFLRLFGRAPEPSEMEDGAEFPWDSAPLLVGVSPRARFELERLLRNTLQISARKRYASDEDLLDQIETITSLVRENPPYLLDLPKWQPSAFHLGREKELKSVREHLSKDGFVFLRGMGGIGKSELAKQYVKQFSGEYHTIQFCKYTDSLKTLVAGIAISGLQDSDYSDLNTLANEKKKILQQCDCHTLLVVDNFNVTFDPYLREFLPTDGRHFHVVFTTRCLPAPEYYAPMVMQIPSLSAEDCLTLFMQHYKLPLDSHQEEDARNLIERLERNTLLLHLTAKAMRRALLTPLQMIEKLDAQATAEITPDIFFEYDYSDDDTEAYNRLYGHLNTVYSVSRLKQDEKDTLKCLTLVSPGGLSLNMFSQACRTFTHIPNQVENLAALGWIDLDAAQQITMHQVVSDILASKAELKASTAFEQVFDALLSNCDVAPEIHFSKAIAHLQSAIHLNRRCGDVPVEYQIDCKLTLGALYLNLYQAKNAKRLISDAESLSRQNGNLYLPYVLLQKGLAEAQFGRQEDAANLFGQVIQSGQINVEQFGEAMLVAMIRKAMLLSDNNENESALREYDRAIAFASDHGLAGNLSDVFSACEELCRELDDARMEQYYQRQSAILTGNEFPVVREQDPIRTQLEQGHIGAAQREYARLLKKCQEELGDDSPVYQDAGRWQWMLYVLLGDAEQSFHELNSSMEFVEKYYGDHSVEMAELLSWVGRLMPEVNELRYALDAAQRAVSILEELQSTSRYAYTRARLAMAAIYRLLGQLSEAEKQLDSVSFDNYAGSAFLEDLIRTAGPILCEVGRYSEASILCQKIVTRSSIDPISLAFAQVILSTCYVQQGDLLEAKQIADQIDKSAMDQYDTMTIKQSLRIMYGRCMSQLAYINGNYDEAISFLDELLQDIPVHNELFLYRIYAERGLFLARIGEAEKAEHDFQCAEEILKRWDFPDEAYQLLYNNASVLYTEVKNPLRAKHYLDKLIAICPNVLHPRTFLETAICHNIGWNSHLLGDNQTCEPLLKRAILQMEKLGMENSFEYWRAQRNLGLLYSDTGRVGVAIAIYQKTVDGLMNCSEGVQAPLRLTTVIELAMLLYRANRPQDVKVLVAKVIPWFLNLYGENTPQYVELLLQTAELALSYGDGDFARHQLEISKNVCSGETFQEAGYRARTLNDLGVYYVDVTNEFLAALTCLLSAASILENLGEIENELYAKIQQNIIYVQQKMQ